MEKIAVPLLSAAMSRGIGRPVQVEVLETDIEGFGIAEAAMALLSVPVAGLAILTKKWQHRTRKALLAFSAGVHFGYRPWIGEYDPHKNSP